MIVALLFFYLEHRSNPIGCLSEGGFTESSAVPLVAFSHLFLGDFDLLLMGIGMKRRDVQFLRDMLHHMFDILAAIEFHGGNFAIDHSVKRHSFDNFAISPFFAELLRRIVIFFKSLAQFTDSFFHILTSDPATVEHGHGIGIRRLRRFAAAGEEKCRYQGYGDERWYEASLLFHFSCWPGFGGREFREIFSVS